MDLKREMARLKTQNERLGWYDKEVPFPEAIALLHSEVSEALEAWNKWGLTDRTPQEWEWESQPDPDYSPYMPKPEGVGSEFADIFIRLLAYCSRFGIDLETEYERKMAYNATRSYRHGGKRI